MADKKLISRLKTIVKEAGGQRKFGIVCGMSNAMVSLVLSGQRDISADMILASCIKLGYTPEWIMLGTGDRKQPGKDSVKLITEIQYFRTELELANTKIKLLDARMKAYEKEFEDFKNGVKDGVKTL